MRWLALKHPFSGSLAGLPVDVDKQPEIDLAGQDIRMVAEFSVSSGYDIHILSLELRGGMFEVWKREKRNF